MAIGIHYNSPILESGLSSLAYKIADYSSISAAICCAYVETREGLSKIR